MILVKLNGVHDEPSTLTTFIGILSFNSRPIIRAFEVLIKRSFTSPFDGIFSSGENLPLMVSALPSRPPCDQCPKFRNFFHQFALRSQLANRQSQSLDQMDFQNLPDHPELLVDHISLWQLAPKLYYVHGTKSTCVIDWESICETIPGSIACCVNPGTPSISFKLRIPCQ